MQSPTVDATTEARDLQPPKDRRQGRRIPIPDLQVGIEKPGDAGLWVVDALDISSEGLGIVLAPEFTPGTELLLTFQLDEETTFLRIPAVVVRHELGAGAVRFRDWPRSERRRLGDFLFRLVS